MPASLSVSISAQELLESGAHFGHRVSRWNPRMAPYVYGKRNSIYIIDVRQTIKGLIKACVFLEHLAKQGQVILFVGTKRQATSVTEKEAKRCGCPYVSQRWLGGTLTNHATIRERLKRLREIEQWDADNTIQRYSKKEQSQIQREKKKLLRNLEGIRTMDKLPAALLIVDPCHENIAVAEAAKVGAATVALVDTDSNPENIDVVIPGNDDSIKVVQIILSKLADAIAAGKAQSVGAVVAKEEPVTQVAAVSAGGKGKIRISKAKATPEGITHGD